MFSQAIYQVAQDHRRELRKVAEDHRLIETARARRPRCSKHLPANLGHFLNLLGPWLKTQYRSFRGDHVASLIKYEIKEKA